MSSIQSHEIVLNKDEPQRKPKFIALKFKGKNVKAKALQVEESNTEDSDECNEDSNNDKTSLFSKKKNN